MKQGLQLCVFAGYVSIGLLSAWRGQISPDGGGRRVVTIFLLYTLVASCGAGLLQRDLWPFSNWPLVAGIQPLTVQHARLVAVDRRGREHNVDYRAWEPFPSDELIAWANRRFLELSPADRDRAADFLVERIERARLSAREGRRVGYFDRVWGPFAAPYFLLHPDWWSSPTRTPPDPLVGIRLYHETWQVDQRRSDPSAVQRSLVYGYLRQ